MFFPKSGFQRWHPPSDQHKPSDHQKISFHHTFTLFFNQPAEMSLSELEILEQTLRRIEQQGESTRHHDESKRHQDEPKPHQDQDSEQFVPFLICKPIPQRSTLPKRRLQVTFPVAKERIQLLQPRRMRHRSQYNRQPYEHSLRGLFTFYVYQDRQLVDTFQLPLQISHYPKSMSLPRATYDRQNKGWFITFVCELSGTPLDVSVTIVHPRAHPTHVSLTPYIYSDRHHRLGKIIN
jgi:hypothetical protein